MLRCFVKRTEAEKLEPWDGAVTDALADPGALVWVDLQDASDEEVTRAGAALGLAELTLEDIRKGGQRAKLEPFPSYTYLVMFTARVNADATDLDLEQVDVAFGDHWVLTRHPSSLDLEGQLRERLNARAALRDHVPDALVYAVADAVVDSYFPLLDALDDQLDSLEDEVVERPRQAQLHRILEMKRGVNRLRRVIGPQMEAFARLTNPAYALVREDHIVYFRDVHDHLIRAFEVVDGFRDLLASALDAYLSTVNNLMNEVMKRLTVVGSIFLPITFVTGVFGMNFGHLPQVRWDAGELFWLALLGMLVISVAQVWYMRRRGWM